MRLRHIAIENFRKLRPRHEIGPIEDGLTVIAGDNEEGKSTLLAALKAALFEHFTVGGSAREAMQPHEGGDPTVTLAFEMQDGRYSLEKTFKRSGGVRLATPEGTFKDDEAERRLQALLRFERRQGRADVQPRHHGLQGVFWVDQGTTFDARGFEALSGLRDRLGGAVEAELEAIGSERTRRLVAAVNARAGEYWTEGSRDLKSSPAGLAEQKLADIRDAIADLTERRRRYDAKVDELAGLRRKRGLQETTDAVGDARRHLAELQTALEKANRLEAALKTARAEKESAARARQALQDRKGRREALTQAIGAEEGRLRTLHEAIERTRAEREAVHAQARQAETRQFQAEQAIERIELALKLTGLREKRGRLEKDRATLATDLQKARAAHEEARRLRSVIEPARATKPAMERLRRADREHREARIALKAVATRVEFDPTPEGRVLIEGAEHEPSAALNLSESTEIELRPFGRIRVIPGGGDVVSHRQAVRAAEDALKQALETVGEVDLDAAERAHARLQKQESLLKEHERDIAGLCERYDVEDPEKLADALSNLDAELETISQQLASLTARDDIPAALGDELDGMLEARRTERKATTELAVDLTGRQSRFDGDITDGEARISETEDHLAREKRKLAIELEEMDADSLDAALGQALEVDRQKGEAVATIEGQLAEARPEELVAAVELQRRRIEELEEEGRRLDNRIRALEGELRGLGEGEDGERLAAFEEALPAAEAQARRQRRTAEAWLLLKRTLKDAEKTRREALVAPVKAKLAPLLGRLFPDAEPILNAETMGLSGLERRGVEEPFTSLSVGTREQVSVLVRLALAQLMKEREGETSCLVLDDALVYADELRFDAMKHILDQAASALQILVLTCRPRDYSGLGRLIHLEDCRRA